MFDRSACARVRISADAHAELAALTTLAVAERGEAVSSDCAASAGSSSDECHPIQMAEIDHKG